MPKPEIVPMDIKKLKKCLGERFRLGKSVLSLGREGNEYRPDVSEYIG